MLLQQQIKEDMKSAMKAKEQEKLMAIRGVMASMTNKLVELGRMPTDELSDDEVLAVIRTEGKRRKDSIQQFGDAGRDDLVAGEKAELVVLEAYLPAMMSQDAIRTIAIQKKEELGITDKSQMGKFVGTLMGELKGKADGTDVKAVVESLF